MPPPNKTKLAKKNKENLQNQLSNIVSNQQNLQNQSGQVQIADKFFKPGGVFEPGQQGMDPSEMNSAQQAIYNFYAGSTPNAYQQQIQNFMDQSPAAMQVYKDSGLKGAGLNAFMTTVPAQLAEKSMIMQGLKALTGVAENVFPAISNAYTKSKEIAGQMIDTGMQGLESGLDVVDDAINIGGIPQNITDKIGSTKDAVKDAFTNQTVVKPKTFTAFNRPAMSAVAGIPSLLNTSTDTPGVERLFKLPSNFKGDFSNQYFLGTGPGTESFKDNYLVKNPALLSSNQLMGMNLNQGGLASLDNPDYDMLMNASNFGF